MQPEGRVGPLLHAQKTLICSQSCSIWHEGDGQHLFDHLEAVMDSSAVHL